MCCSPCPHGGGERGRLGADRGACVCARVSAAPQADKRFTLMNHERSHATDRPFGCPHCDYRSTSKVRVWGGGGGGGGGCAPLTPPPGWRAAFVACARAPRPTLRFGVDAPCVFRGPPCVSAAPGAQGALAIHERAHLGDKPFACQYCPYRAVQKGAIMIHERIHTGEKPYGALAQGACLPACLLACAHTHTQRAHARTWPHRAALTRGPPPHVCAVLWLQPASTARTAAARRAR